MKELLLSEFDYYLPEELIAQFPAQKRDYSKLLVLSKSNGQLEHKHFYDIVEVIPANQIILTKESME